MKKNLFNGIKFVSLNKKLKMVPGIIFLFFICSVQTLASVDKLADQQKTISGKVVNTGGEPIPGVTVAVVGTTNGTVTGDDGTYTLTNISDGAVLQFSFVGMRTHQEVVSNQSTINVTLMEDAIGLDEVVVTALGIEDQVKV